MHEQTIGRIKEFIEESKWQKAAVFTLVIASVFQLITGIVSLATLSQIVKKNTEYLWTDVAPRTTDNTRNIDKILAKFELIQVIQGAKGDRGYQGVRGEKGGSEI